MLLNRLRSFIRSGLVRSNLEREFDDEIRDHLDRDIAERVARGLDPRHNALLRAPEGTMLLLTNSVD